MICLPETKSLFLKIETRHNNIDSNTILMLMTPVLNFKEARAVFTVLHNLRMAPKS